MWIKNFFFFNQIHFYQNSKSRKLKFDTKSVGLLKK